MLTSWIQSSRAIKVILASLLLAAMTVSAVGCDIIAGLQDAVEPQSQETTEAFTYPEIETEKYQTLSMDELGFDMFNYWDMNKALSGLYYQLYQSEVVEMIEDGFNPDTVMGKYMYAMFGQAAQEISTLQKKAKDSISNIVEDKNKNLTINFSLVNSIYKDYALLISDEDGVCVIFSKDKYTGETKLVNGIINGKYFYSDTMQFVTPENTSAIQSFLQNHTFAEFTTNLLSFLPAHILPLDALQNIGEMKDNEFLIPIAKSGNNLEKEIDYREMSLLSMVFSIESDKNFIIKVITGSRYIEKDGDGVTIPTFAELIGITFEDGIADELVQKYLSGNYEQKPLPETAA